MKLQLCEKCDKFFPERFNICPHCRDALIKKKNLHGQIAFILFWLFNIVMGVWHIFYWVETSAALDSKADSANSGHILSSAISGSIEIVFFWLMGYFILGIWMLKTQD